MLLLTVWAGPVGVAVAQSPDLGDDKGGDVPPGDPGDPPGELHPCIEAALNIGRTCAQQNRQAAENCGQAIAGLFQDGNPQQAHAVAGACIEQINEHSAQCLDVLHNHCETCIETLIENEAPVHLIEAVVRSCMKAERKIRSSRRKSVARVKGAVNVGDARLCSMHLREMAANCAQQNQQGASDCVEQIEALLEAGEVQQAVQLAQQCIRQITEHSLMCVHGIRAGARQCIEHLGDEDASQPLIRMVRQAKRDAVGRVFESAGQAVLRIRAALPEPPDDGGPDKQP